MAATANRNADQATFQSRIEQIQYELKTSTLMTTQAVKEAEVKVFVAEAQRVVEEQVELPAGYMLRWGGQFENLQQATQRLFIALFGIAVMNGVVLIEHVRHLRHSGVSQSDAVVNGALDRLRPVLMTALCGALGFIPMALSASSGAEVQRPLATVVIGGLITSTALTLLVLPTIYRWFEPKQVDPEVYDKAQFQH